MSIWHGKNVTSMGPAIGTNVSKSYNIFLLQSSNKAQVPGLLDAPKGKYQSLDTRGSNDRERVNAHIGIGAKMGFSAKLPKSTGLSSTV